MHLAISRFCTLFHLRMKSSCNVRMFSKSCAPQDPPVSTVLCTISSWNCPGHTLSLPGFDISYVYNFPNSITCSHLPGPTTDYKSYVGESCQGVPGLLSPYMSLGMVATIPFPIFPRTLAKSIVRSDASQLTGKTGNNLCWNHKPKQGYV